VVLFFSHVIVDGVAVLIFLRTLVLSFFDLFLPKLPPFFDRLVILAEVLQLLNFEYDRDVQLVELSHFLLLEVLNLLFRVFEVGLNALLTAFELLPPAF